MADSVLIDTSVWIEYFRKVQPYFDKTETLIEEKRVCTASIILAELLQGSRSDSEFVALQSASEVFEVLEADHLAWVDAARLSSRLRRKGKSVGLADCLIATLAHRSHCLLWTLDKHFKLIRAELSLSLYSA